MIDHIANLMLQIKSIDNTAHLAISEYTGKWYIASRLEICGNGVLTGIVEHRETTAEAVVDFFARLTSIESPLRLAVITADRRREYTWNGAAFAEYVA